MAGPNISYNPLLSDGETQEATSEFPQKDTEINATAQLQTIHIGRLSDRDKTEEENLFKAAQTDGFFYLDFQGSSFVGMLPAVEEVFCLSEDLFGLTQEEKMEYDVDKLGDLKLNGYFSLAFFFVKYMVVGARALCADEDCSDTSLLDGTSVVNPLRPLCFQNFPDVTRHQRQMRRLRKLYCTPPFFRAVVHTIYSTAADSGEIPS